MIDDYENYYNEPSQAEMAFEELKDMLKSQVKDEIKEQIKKLEEENKRMKSIVANYDDKVKELEYKERELEREKQNMSNKIRHEIKRERLTELLDGFSTIYWGVKNKGKEQPKCDKCDEDGYIHFLSPSGRELTERCSCRDKIPFFVVEQMECVEFRIKSDNISLLGFYKPHIEKDEDYDYYDNSQRIDEENIYNGQPYDEIEWSWKVYFKTKEEAQKYADWLNEN